MNKEKASVNERARRYLAKMGPAISGSGGHTHTLLAARALVRGFLLPPTEALALLDEWNQSNSEKWSTHELEHKLRSAANGPGQDGYLLGEGTAFEPVRSPLLPTKPRPKLAFDPEMLRRLAGEQVVDLPWLANRSEIDPAGIDATHFLSKIYNAEAGERVIVFSEYKSQGQALWPVDPIPTAAPDGIWFLAQPVDGKLRPNPRIGKMSRRSEESVLAWRWMVLESDDAPLRLWLAALSKVVPRIAAITTSGGRSVHALVRVDAPTKKAWDAEKKRILGLVTVGADPGALSAVRLTRLPGCMRGSKQQKLLYFSPSAPSLPISEILPRRDVLQHWLAEASRLITTGYPAMQIHRAVQACRYYERFDVRLRDVGDELEERFLTPP